MHAAEFRTETHSSNQGMSVTHYLVLSSRILLLVLKQLVDRLDLQLLEPIRRSDSLVPLPSESYASLLQLRVLACETHMTIVSSF